MEITFQVSEDTARSLLGEGPTTPEAGEILEIVSESGFRLEPLYPGTRDPALSGYFVVSVPDLASAERIVNRLHDCHAVEAAYVKPPGEPPQEAPGGPPGD